jgi:acetyl esterase
MSMTATSTIVLEPAAQQVADAFSKPPFLYDTSPADARKVLMDAQSGPVSKLPIDEEWITVPSPVGDVRVRIIRPKGADGMLPVIVYMHGGGWILGNAQTHDRLVRELAVGAGAALAFVEYPNSPEAHYPTAIEMGYATAQWITRNGATKNLDGKRMAVAGESVGGNMTAALALMAKERGDVTFVQQSMYYPVTDAAMDTASYEQFATGY